MKIFGNKKEEPERTEWLGGKIEKKMNNAHGRGEFCFETIFYPDLEDAARAAIKTLGGRLAMAEMTRETPPPLTTITRRRTRGEISELFEVTMAGLRAELQGHLRDALLNKDAQYPHDVIGSPHEKAQNWESGLSDLRRLILKAFSEPAMQAAIISEDLIKKILAELPEGRSEDAILEEEKSIELRSQEQLRCDLREARKLCF